MSAGRAARSGCSNPTANGRFTSWASAGVFRPNDVPHHLVPLNLPVAPAIAAFRRQPMRTSTAASDSQFGSHPEQLANLRAAGVVHGLLMKLSPADIERLYSEPGVRAYRPEPVSAVVRSGATIAALCYNLPEPPEPDERNAEYASRLRLLAEQVGLPADYVATIQ